MHQRISVEQSVRLVKTITAIVAFSLAGCASTSSPGPGTRYKGDAVWNVASTADSTRERAAG